MISPRFLTLVGIIGLAAFSRIVPHPWNFSPVAAMALFGGAQFQNKGLAFLVPLAAVLLSDAVIGFYPGMGMIYIGYIMIVGIGIGIGKRLSMGTVAGAALASSVVFFLWTNMVAWYYLPVYPKTMAGLMSAYTVGIPFFRHTVLGDLFFSGILFGSFYLAERKISAIQRVPV